MVVCKFWLNDSCRFGNNCKFEHPPKTTGGFQNSQNRFAALQSPANSPNKAFGGSNGALPYMLKPEVITDDLTKERPQWILSAYGPGKGAPAQLFGGSPREQSFEEMRLHHYQAVAAGNPQQAIQEAQGLVNTAEQQMQNAVANMDGALKFLLDGAHQHPNRLDIVSNNAASDQQANTGTANTSFGQPSAQATGAFGQPSQPAAASGGAFGQPSALGTVSAFGKPAMGGSAFGQPAAGASTFGQSSQLGSGASAFGQPSQIGAASGFGKPSMLGGAQSSPWGSSQNATNSGSSPFGQSATNAPAVPAFGQSSTTATAPSAFGQPSQLGATSAFGQPSQLGASSAFGKPSQLGANAPSPFSTAAAGTTSAFGQPSQLGANAPSPFGQASTAAAQSGFGAFGQPSAAPQQSTTGVFGNAAQPNAQSASPFGNATQAKPTPFGAPSQAAPSNPFGAPADQSASTNPFASSAQPVASTNPFGAPAQPAVAPGQGQAQGNVNTTRQAGTNRITTFQNHQVFYPDESKPMEPCIRRPDGKWERVWYPDGPPLVKSEDTELSEDMYDEATKGQYLAVKNGGSFGPGGIPWLPPKRDWCSWDF